MMTKKGFVTLLIAGLLILALGIVIPVTMHAGGKEVTIMVDGLACPFCAYGLEKKLKALEGVEGLKFYINEGKVALTFKDGASINKEANERAVDEEG